MTKEEREEFAKDFEWMAERIREGDDWKSVCQGVENILSELNEVEGQES